MCAGLATNAANERWDAQNIPVAMIGELACHGVMAITCVINRLDATYTRNLVVINQIAKLVNTSTPYPEGKKTPSFMVKFMREIEKLRKTKTHVKCMVSASARMRIH